MSEEELEIPGKSSGVGLYIAGIAVLAAATIGLLVWRSNSTPPPPVVTTAAPPATTVAPPPPMFAPPPPPKIEAEPEPTATASAAGSGKAVAGTGGTGGPNPCGKCGEGEVSSALSSAINSAAQGARGCYNRVVQKSEVSGRMTVSVQVGSTGAVCSAAIGSDTVGSAQVSSCVLSRFQGRSFPPPTRGCVVVNVPINFTIKQ